MTSAERVGALPEVPTLNEAALPGYVAVGWNGLVGPAGIPRAIVDRIHASVGVHRGEHTVVVAGKAGRALVGGQLHGCSRRSAAARGAVQWG